MKLQNHFIASIVLFLFFISPPAFAEIIVFKNGKELKVEKAWSEDDQIYFIFKGLQAGIPQNKVKRIKSISKDRDAKSERQNNKKIVSDKFNSNSAKDLPALKIEQSDSISSKSHRTIAGVSEGNPHVTLCHNIRNISASCQGSCLRQGQGDKPCDHG